MVQIKDNHLLLTSSIVPTAFLVISYIKHSTIWIIGTALSLFVLVALLPFCHRRENLWMFIFVAIFGLPINIYLSKECTPLLFGDDSGIELFCYSALVFFVLFSIEEIAFATITRIIWRRQYKLFPKDFDEL